MRTLRTYYGVLAVCFTVVLAMSSLAEAENFTETFDQTYPLSNGGTVSLENINGNVSFGVWSAQEVRVHAIKEASSQKRLDGLKIQADLNGNSVAIDTEYPSSRSYSFFGGDKGSAKVTYTVTVPANARLRAVELVNGRLDITGIEGGVEASTVNGRITASGLVGSTELETVNGSIEADCDRLASGDHVRLESVNGSINLYLAGSASARLDVETVNGSIKNDFGIEVQKGRWIGRSMSGDIGGGDVPIDISTVNGSIRVHQR